MEPSFNHEKLDVYQESLALCGWWETCWRRCATLPNLRDQMDRASSSIPLNIAEGNGRFTPRDRSHYFRIAATSALECAACLDVLVVRGRLKAEEVLPAKRRLQGIVRMLYGLVGSSAHRISDAAEFYDATLTEINGDPKGEESA